MCHSILASQAIFSFKYLYIIFFISNMLYEKKSKNREHFGKKFRVTEPREGEGQLLSLRYRDLCVFWTHNLEHFKADQLCEISNTGLGKRMHWE